MLGGGGGGVGGVGSGPGQISKNISRSYNFDPIISILGRGRLLFENASLVDFPIVNEAMVATVGQTQRKLSILKRGTGVYITRSKDY